MKSKKFIVTSLFLIAILMISFSTYNFIKKIPDIDDQLNKKENDLKIQSGNCLLYQSTLGQAISLDQQRVILEEINPTSSSLKTLENQTAQQYAGAYLYFKLCINKKLIDIDSVSSMDLEEIKEVYKTSFATFSNNGSIQELNNQLEEDISELKKEKQDILFWSSIMQISGLLLNQVAIILEVLWKKE